MAIVNNVVTAHHGQIKLETSEKGTSFLAQLPQFAINGAATGFRPDSAAPSPEPTAFVVE